MLRITPADVVQTVAPVADPVTLAEMRAHLRVDNTAEDTWISSAIASATKSIEAFTGRAFVPRTYQATVPNFYDVMTLPWSPIIGITSIQYYDESSPVVLQTLASTVYELTQNRILRRSGQSWPTLDRRYNAVLITYTAGDAPTSSPEVPAESVGEDVKMAIMLTVADLFENREGTIVNPIISVNPAVMAMMAHYRQIR
jgi:uncharacterized phiE125 gp8 family phage protein